MIQLWKHKFRCAFCFTFEERDACKLFQMICLRRKLELKHFVLPSCYWRLVIFTVPNWISNVRHIQIQAVTLFVRRVFLVYLIASEALLLHSSIFYFALTVF